MTAYFAARPRTWRDLHTPHLLTQERKFEIVKTVELYAIDYENFTEDLLADRQFLEGNAALCDAGEMLRCILVRKRGASDGVLVVPKRAFVELAAYYAPSD